MSDTEIATVAGGCFWCTEAVFKQLAGVERVTSGYAGGRVENPSYEAVCRGETGHAECVQVEYDPDVLSYEDVLTVFFSTHDPTTKDREGPDVGSQYRSAVFYHGEAQREAVEAFVDDLQSAYDDDIVTGSHRWRRSTRPRRTTRTTSRRTRTTPTVPSTPPPRSRRSASSSRSLMAA